MPRLRANQSIVNRLYMNSETQFKCLQCLEIFPKNKNANRKYCVRCSAKKTRDMNYIRYHKLKGNRSHKCKSCENIITDCAKKTCDNCKEIKKVKKNFNLFLKDRVIHKPRSPEEFSFELLGISL